ncbi:MAG: hypothetical protein Q8O83_04640 [bacterium]|nr:hypothetical protein [bacterium]
MVRKEQEQQKATQLRRRGFSYREILEQVPVAKSTLSLWLRVVGLSKRQKQRLTEKKLAAAFRGAEQRRRMRLEMTKAAEIEAQKQFKKLRNNKLFFAGVMLYWAEGAKQKTHNVSQKVAFSNSDPRMIRLFLLWLTKIIGLKRDDFSFELYIHRTGDIRKSRRHWSKAVGCSEEEFRVYFKNNRVKKSYRRNTNAAYFGLLRVVVKRSTTLNRKISVWAHMVCDYCGVV